MKDKIVEATKDSITLQRKMLGNETTEHFLLKQVAAFWLRTHECNYVGTEVFVGTEENQGKSIADAVGLIDKYDRNKKKRVSVVKIVEIKVSRADFGAGYCKSGNYNYVMCPPGLIEAKDVPSEVGILYCDLYSVGLDSTGGVTGVDVHKKSKKRSMEGQKMMPLSIMRSMLHNYTIRTTWANPWMEYIMYHYPALKKEEKMG